MKLNITAIILTYNEALNIRECLKSVEEIASQIIIVDSGSTDATITIAKEFNCDILTHSFENYSQQRNWALSNAKINNEWILNLDADHRLTLELQKELRLVFSNDIAPAVNGFLTSRKTIFMGKWIRYGGHYPTYHATLFRKNKGFCEIKNYDQHFKVEGNVVKLKGDVIDVITDSLFNFTNRHNKWSDFEAHDQVFKEADNNSVIKSDLRGNPIQKRRYLKSIYEKFPLFVRPFIYFIIRYFFRLGFLDGTTGLIFHFLQGFWFRFLVDAKVYELKRSSLAGTSSAAFLILLLSVDNF
ncbi:MAG TPA: glycosyltransferase family 2 protein [Chitinophagaceae bacterium]|nr:glycosyltransferase family 2 protein [Chitinophagaceae bacterium]